MAVPAPPPRVVRALLACAVGLLVLFALHAALPSSGSAALESFFNYGVYYAILLLAAALTIARGVTVTAPTAQVITNLAYPLADLVLLAMVVGILAMTGWKPGRTWLLLGAGLLAFGLSDSIYLFQSANNTYVEGTLVDLGWPAAM